MVSRESVHVPENKREAAKHFAAMAGCYFLGTFNDNFFKQAVLLIAVSKMMTQFQGYALMAFTLPFVILAAYSGWFSDRFSKRHVVIASKWIELAAMIAGGAGMLFDSWALIMVMLFTMGTQAAVFSPAINGAIPELYEGNDVVKANGIFRMSVMIAILLGTGLSGFVLDIPGRGPFDFERGRIVLSTVIFCVAVLGVFAAYRVFSKGPADPHRRFPWFGPLNTLKVLYGLRKDTLFICVILLDMFIRSAGSIQILLINPLGVIQFGMSKSVTSLLLVSQLVGIGIGGLLCSRFTKGERWYMIIIPAGLGMAVFMGLIGLVPFVTHAVAMPLLFLSVGFVGLFGGLFMIPLESFIQIRPSPENKGTVWASANFITFTGIMLSGLYGNLLNDIMRPTNGFAVLGMVTAAVTLAACFVFRKGDLK
jgi:acyl-[acyl-carrier-protein]-phospholipid O-acyltransferase/long-chain-fatty-acid--[acyl-carrier-protein] ligase